MCTLIIAKNVVFGYPLIVAHDRDEFLERPFGNPRLWRDYPGLVAPVDGIHGGTWLGAHGRDVVAAITNRMGEQAEEPVRSRGLLCLDALAAGSLAAAKEKVEAAVARSHYSGFNLLLADSKQALLISLEQGCFTEEELADGVHVVTSTHHLNPPSLTNLRKVLLAAAQAGSDSFMAQLRHFLASHAPLPTGYSVCKHLGPYGTVAAAIVLLPQTGTPRFFFAHGPPCQVPLVELPATLTTELEA